MAVTEITALYTRVGALMGGGWATPSGDNLTGIYEAMTAAAKAASNWDNEKWWWCTAITDSFSTVIGTGSYALSTAMSASARAIQRLYYDDDSEIDPMSYRDFSYWYHRLRPTESQNIPTHYLLTGSTPTIYLRPVPDAVYTIYGDCLNEHATINGSAADTDLVIPQSYRYEIYVLSTLWLLRASVENVVGLEGCAPFMAAMRRMKREQPGQVDREAERDYDDFPNPYEDEIVPIENGMLPSWMG